MNSGEFAAMHLLRPLQCGSSFLFVLFAPTLCRHFSAEVGLSTSTIFELRFFLGVLGFPFGIVLQSFDKNAQTPAPILDLAASWHSILLRPIGFLDCGWLRPSPTLATPSADVEGVELLLHPVAYYPSVSAWHLQQLFDRGISFLTFTLSPTFFTTWPSLVR